MPKSEWKEDYDLLAAPAVVQVVEDRHMLSDEELRALLERMLADVLDPPSLGQAMLKFRQKSTPATSILEVLRETRRFCERVTRSNDG